MTPSAKRQAVAQLVEHRVPIAREWLVEQPPELQ
jgi:hypothetical protein